MRTLSFVDHLLARVDALYQRQTPLTTRPNPANHLSETPLSGAQTKQVIGMMRVNHAGEKAAQGLYLGQAITARSLETRDHMQQAAGEEIDHLAWCRERLDTLGGRVSHLDPVWHLGSIAIGMAAGLLGDRYSLGFIAETERQVSAHLQTHIEAIANLDRKSCVILRQMQQDEEKHAETAMQQGGQSLPRWIKTLMRLTAKIMVTTAYHF